MEYKDALASLNKALLDHSVPSGFEKPIAKDSDGSGSRHSESAKITIANQNAKQSTSSRSAFNRAHPESKAGASQKPLAPKAQAAPAKPKPISPLKPLASLDPIKPKI